MKKAEKLSILISIVLISLLAISAVSAADADDAIGAVSTDDAPAVADAQDTTTIAKESSSPEPVKEAETEAVAADPQEPGTFDNLNHDVNDPFYINGTNKIDLTRDYVYDSESDTQYESGVVITPSPKGGNTLIINGNGHTIETNRQANIFVLDEGINLILENLILKQAQTAVTVNDAASSLTAENVTFQGSDVAISNEVGGSVEVCDSTFKNNVVSIFSVCDLTIPDQKPETEPDEESLLELFDVKIVNSIFTEGKNGNLGLFVNNSAVFISNSTFQDFFDSIEEPNAAILAMNSFLAIGDNTTFDSNWDSIVMDNTALIMDEVEFTNGGTSIIANNTPLLVINNTLFKDNFFITMTLNNTLTAFMNHVAFIGNDGYSEVYGYEGEATIFANNTLNLDMYETVFINNTGAIFAENSIIFANRTAFINNSDEDDDFGTAVMIGNGMFSVTDSFFANNTGAIDIINGILNVENSTFIKNIDGAIWAFNSTVNINETLFKRNAAEVGGAIYVDDNSTANIIGSTFTENIAIDGGAIYNEGELNIFFDTVFEDNAAEQFGGAIYNIANLTVAADFINNTALNSGGAIYSGVGAETYISDSEFTNNTIFNPQRRNYGGAFYNAGYAYLSFVIFEGNEAYTGGAIHTEETGVSTIDYTAFTANNALGSGGAISNKGFTNVTQGTFENNIAGNNGGAIYNNAENYEYAMVIMDSKFKNDIADNGAEIYTVHDDTDEVTHHSRFIHLIGSTISNNIEDEENFLVCGNTGESGCIIQEYNEIYTQIVNYESTILNNVTDKVVLFFTLDVDVYDTQLFDNITIFIDGELAEDAISYIPYIIEGLEPGLHNITAIYGGYGFDYEEGYDTILVNVTESVVTLEDEIDFLNGYIDFLEGQVDDLEGQVDDLNKTVNELNATVESLEKVITTLEEGNFLLKDQLNKTNETLQHTIALLKQTEFALNNTQQALDKANADLAAKTAEANAAQAQVTQLTQQVTTLTQENNQLKQDNTKLNNDVKTANNNANAKIKKIKAKSSIKKSKKLTVTVTLNKKVKGKYVFVAFNGKVYKKKTSSKGVAKITIKASALKKALGKSKSKKVKYQIISGNSLKNKSVKIKK